MGSNGSRPSCSANYMNLKLHINQLDDLDKVLELSILVFEPPLENIKKYHDKSDWLIKIENGGLLVSAWDNERVVGFSICYPKEGKFHIWNVGVLKEYRKLGIWKMMYEEIEKFAKEGSLIN